MTVATGRECQSTRWSSTRSTLPKSSPVAAIRTVDVPSGSETVSVVVAHSVHASVGSTVTPRSVNSAVYCPLRASVAPRAYRIVNSYSAASAVDSSHRIALSADSKLMNPSLEWPACSDSNSAVTISSSQGQCRVGVDLIGWGQGRELPLSPAEDGAVPILVDSPERSSPARGR